MCSIKNICSLKKYTNIFVVEVDNIFESFSSSRTVVPVASAFEFKNKKIVRDKKEYILIQEL